MVGTKLWKQSLNHSKRVEAQASHSVSLRICTVNVDRFEHPLNEGLEGLREVCIGLARAVVLDGLLKLLDRHLAVLI